MTPRPLKYTSRQSPKNEEFADQTPIISPQNEDGAAPLPRARNGRRIPPQPGLDVMSTARLMEDYLIDCDYRMQSQETIATRRAMLKNLRWFLDHRKLERCGTAELRQFFHYLQHGHEEPGGRWGNPQQKRPVRPVTVKDYYVNFRCFFNWMVDDGWLDISPLDPIPKPIVRVEQVQPFTQEQIEALRRAARKSVYPKRNEAIILFLYDTGVRASELCNLRMKDLDMSSRHAYVLGKGNKHRMVYFSRETGRLVALYLRQDAREAEDPVFLSYPSPPLDDDEKRPMTRSGLLQLIERMGKTAGIKGMKVSPHVFRHSAAIQLLRNGCDVYSLMSLLGHTSLTICLRYLKLSQADVQEQHMRYSPVDSLTRKANEKKLRR